MGGSLVKTDFRPYFFRVIEMGRKVGIISFARLKTLQEEGAKITVQVAKKQYCIVNQVDLWQASYNACGIISIALRQKFDEDLVRAAQFIDICGLSYAFRIGWDMIGQIVQAEKKLDNVQFNETDFCELISAEPETENWIGWQEYQSEKINVLCLEEENDYLEWMIVRWCKKSDQETREWNAVRDRFFGRFKAKERMREIVTTYLFSLFISKKPFAPLCLKEVSQIMIGLQDLDKTNLMTSFNERQVVMQKEIPQKWHRLFERDVNDFFVKNLPEIAGDLLRKSKKGDQRVFTWMQNHLFVDIKNKEIDEVYESII